MEINIRSLRSDYNFTTNRNLLELTVPNDLGFVKESKLKIEIPLDIELHLRNSEVVGIPLWSPENTKLISHSYKSPIQGTHHGLFLTFIFENNILLNKGDKLLNMVFLSKHFWRLGLRNDTEGLLSVPVKINILT